MRNKIVPGDKVRILNGIPAHLRHRKKVYGHVCYIKAATGIYQVRPIGKDEKTLNLQFSDIAKKGQPGF